MCIMGDDILLGSKIDLPLNLRRKIAFFMEQEYNYKIDSEQSPQNPLTTNEDDCSSFLRVKTLNGLPFQAG